MKRRKRLLERYSTVDNRFNYINSRTKALTDSLSNMLPYYKKKLFKGSLEDDYIFLSLTKFNNARILQYINLIPHQDQSEYTALIGLIGLFKEIAKIDLDSDEAIERYDNISSIIFIEHIDEDFINEYKNETWYSLACLSKENYIKSFNKDYNPSANSDCYFLQLWSLATPIEIQDRVVEIFKDHPECFTIEAIYKLTKIAVDPNSEIDLDFYETPPGWILAVLGIDKIE